MQIFARLWYKVYRPGELHVGESDIVLRKCRASWRGPSWREQSFFPPHDFHFLGSRLVMRGGGEWNSCSSSKLWLYNLHYFDDLLAKNADERESSHLDLMHLWLKDNPYGIGCGWEPYTISLRAVNWIKWSWSGHELSVALLVSLAKQLDLLAKTPEYHILANHLFVNAKALIFGGVFFDGVVAEGWLKIGIKILRRELTEQFLPDGAHFELSPMYQSILLEDVLDLLQLTRIVPGHGLSADDEAWLTSIAEKMLYWLYCMRHPDGCLALFNDCAQGIAIDYYMLCDYARSLGVRVKEPDVVPNLVRLPDSGYVRLASGDAIAILDVGDVGPSYQPGHAHADTLSFELSVYGYRVFVNSGTSCYGDGQERLRQRGTAAHNSVVINGKDSSEVWGGFRVARRARPMSFKIAQPPSNDVSIACAHDGYRRLAGAPVHSRQWVASRDALSVCDKVTGSTQSATAHYHIHPKMDVRCLSCNHIQLSQNDAIIDFFVKQGSLQLVDSTFHEVFGAQVANRKILVDLVGGVADVTIKWRRASPH